MSEDPNDRRRHPPPPGFTVRRPSWDDLDAVTGLFAACSLDRVGAVLVRPDDLRIRWLELDSLADALLVEDTRASYPVLVAYADFQVEAQEVDDQPLLYVDGRIHPEYTGRGLAGFLLSCAVERAERAAHAMSTTSAVLRSTVVDGDERARRFFADRGFLPVRHFLRLRLDLHAAPPAPSWPTGITCRTLRPGQDEAAAWSTYEEAFADVVTHLPMTLHEWLESRIYREPGFDPELVFLAGTGGRIIGIAMCRSGSEAAPEDGLVRDLGVIPSWRRRGVGMALLRSAFAAFRLRGLTGAALEVDDVTLDGAVALYRRAGMRVVRRTDVVERTIMTS